MMNQINKVKKMNMALLFVIAISLICCKQNSKVKHDNTNKAEQEMKLIMQSKDDLLSGLSKAVSYSGFRTGQHPDRGDGAVNPTDEQILEDLTILKQADFGLIRLYDCGENSESVLRIITENNLNIKVMLGIWLEAELSNHEKCFWLNEPIPQDKLDQNKLVNAEEIKNGISLAEEYPEIVVAVNVGNEALVEWNDHLVDTDTIISYVGTVKKAIKQPVSVADNYDWWVKKGADLAKVVDFIAIHVYPVWVGKDINEALSHSIENVLEVRNAFPKGKIVITEAGWASVASEFEERASEEKQLKYFNEFMSWTEKMNITTFFFEAFDEDWKGNPDNNRGAEKHWGLFTVDRKPKMVMKQFTPES